MGEDLEGKSPPLVFMVCLIVRYNFDTFQVSLEGKPTISHHFVDAYANSK